MKTKYILLIIGIAGMISGVYGYIQQQDISTALISFICGASLIYGAIELHKKEDEKTKTN